MIITPIKLLTFAFAALSISATSRDKIEFLESKITGVATLLANPWMTREELNQAFISLIKLVSIEPVEAEDFTEAFKLIISYKESYASEALSPTNVSEDIEKIGGDLLKGLSLAAENFKVRFEESVDKVVTLMKREFIFTLKKKKTGPQDRVTIADRVAELKANLEKRISKLSDDTELDRSRKQGLMTKLNEAISDKDADVKALITAFEDNADLFIRPKEVLEFVLVIQIDKIEADIVENKGAAPTPEAVSIVKATFILYFPFEDEFDSRRNGRLFLEYLLLDFKTTGKIQSVVYWPEATPEAVKSVRAFLLNLIRFVVQNGIEIDEDSSNNLLTTLNTYFEDLLPVFDDSYKKHLSIRNFFDSFNYSPNSSKYNLSPEGQRFKKYLNVIAVTYSRWNINWKDAKDLIENLDKYIDISEADLKAFKYLNFYFREASPIQYLEKKDFFWMAFVEFVGFLSSTDLETLSDDKVFSRFDRHLAEKAKKTDYPSAEWDFAFLRIANFLQGPKNFDLSIPALNEVPNSWFSESISHRPFYKARKTILGLLIKENKKRLDALTGTIENPISQDKLIERETIEKQIRADEDAIKEKEDIRPEESESFQDRVAKIIESERLINRINQLLVTGLTFAAEKPNLI